jgi:hypothetical protein
VKTIIVGFRDLLFYCFNNLSNEMLLPWGLKTLIRIAILFMSPPDKSGFKCRRRSWNAENGNWKFGFHIFTTDLHGNFTDIKKLKFSLPAVLFWKAGVSP